MTIHTTTAEEERAVSLAGEAGVHLLATGAGQSKRIQAVSGGYPAPPGCLSCVPQSIHPQ